MSNVLMCQVAYSKTPYMTKEACVNIYSIEELCYFIYNNVYLLDNSFVSDELISWIKDCVQLPKVAGAIEGIKDRANALANLIRILNNEIGYYSEDEWTALLEDVENNSKMSVDMRRKVRADGLLRNGRYAKALEEYESILDDMREHDSSLIAGIYHNLGVCAAQMFLFKNAAEYFSKAYDNYANTDSYQSMLCAMKMSMTTPEYLSFLAEHKESYEDSLEVERRMEILKLSWGEQPAHKYIKELEQKKIEGGSYYESVDRFVEDVKDRYRGYVNGSW